MSEDRRVKRTQASLARALLELVAEKGYDEVSIRDITERADVGYATFFRHYPTKEALLLAVFSETIDELIRLLQPSTAHGQLAEAGRKLFDYVAAHHERLRLLFAAQRVPAVRARMHDAVVARILTASSFRAAPAIPPEIAAHHLAAASTALIEWWLEHGMPYDPRRMGEIYARLIVRPAQMGPDADDL